MLSEWSVECGGDDPVLVVPWKWSGDTLGSDFVDLRQHPYDLDHLPEAIAHPALLHALRALNASRSPIFTAKCDVWEMDAEELQGVQGELEQPGDEQPSGFGSYIDMVWRERSLFASFHQHEQLLHRFVRYAEPLEQPLALLEMVLRPAIVDLHGPMEGFAVTVYVRALGPDRDSANANWGRALEAVVSLIRSRDLAPFRAKGRSELPESSDSLAT